MADQYHKHVFLDLETTGLDPHIDEILEIGAIVVDSELNEVTRFSSMITPTERALAQMNSFVRDMHTKNGLLAEIENSGTITLESVEADLLFTLARFNCKAGEIVLIGRQVGRFDKKFIQKYMPTLNWVCSYRCLELGNIIRFNKEFCGINVQTEKKESNHRSMDDCLDDLATMRALRDHLKKLNQTITVEQ